MKRLCLFVVLAMGFGACGADRPLKVSQAGSGTSGASGGAGAGGAAGDPVLPPPSHPDAGAAGSTPVPPPPPPPLPPPPPPPPPPPEALSCPELEGQPSVPQLLVGFEWIRQKPGCTGNGCIEVVLIEESCELSYQLGTRILTATMSPGDCTAARSWVTTESFLNVLLTGCQAANVTEEFFVTLDHAGSPRRETMGCPNPSVEGVRRCLLGLVQSYFFSF
jgi:hypothetical protein